VERFQMAVRLLLTFGLALAVLHISPGSAEPPTSGLSPLSTAVVVLVPDYLGTDGRAVSYATALRAAQIAVVVVDPPPRRPGWDGDTFLAEDLLQSLFGALLAVREAAPMSVPRIGVLLIRPGRSWHILAAAQILGDEARRYAQSGACRPRGTSARGDWVA
jgi:hypothetical protein